MNTRKGGVIKTLALTLCLVAAPTAMAATTAQLHTREQHQLRTIWRDTHTLVFFKHHRKLAATRSGRKAVRFAAAELRWTRRELTQTRTEQASKTAGTWLWSSASWYGPGLYGNPVACGGTLTPGLVGVAHRTLACGTRIRVCYQARCVDTTVVDRGPYVGGRDFDLTGGLATQLRFGGVGVIKWQLL